MIVERGKGREVIIRRRDGSGKVITERVTGPKPYLFVESDVDWRPAGRWVISTEDGYTGVYGQPLRKLVCTDPSDIPRVREELGVATWEANIPYAIRTMCDLNLMYDNYKHRTWFFDCEWKMQSGEITIIVVQDSDLDEPYVFFTHREYEEGMYAQIPCKEHPEGKEFLRFDGLKARAFKDERSMLKTFAEMMKKRDPDILTGWNVTQADIQQLTKRMVACGLDPRTMSPLRRIRYEYGGWAQPIPGRNCIDLMEAFVHLWTIRNGQLASKGLGDVAQECLKETKIQLENGHDTYYTDFGTYLDYAIRDVELLPKLNAINNAIEHYTAIQHIVGCDIRTAPFITKIVTVLALRDAEFKERIPSRPEFDAVPYTGAEVMEVEAGIHRNIGIMDIKAMYHSNVNLHNISWDTLDEQGKDCGNGVKFRQGERGLLGRLMDKMTNLRNEYKRALALASSDEERTRYDSLQFATKSLVASMYGAAGDSKYGLYHPQVAQAITFTSRETLSRLRDICNEMGLKVIYGHTDSVFCEIPNPEKGLDALKTINERMSPIETEFEKWCESFVIMAKNRYAGMTAWTDGKYHEPSLYVKGIEMKQSRLPPAMKGGMGIMLDGMLKGRTEDEVVGELATLVRSAVSDMPLSDLCIRGKLEKDLSSYKVLGEARAGAAWANDILGKGYRAGSRFLCALNTDGKYIAFDEPEDIQGFAQIGRKSMAERFLVKKVRPYLELVGWSAQPLENALNGWDTGWL